MLRPEMRSIHPTSSRATKLAKRSRSSPKSFEAIAIESKRTIEIDEFVPKKEIDELYLNSPYYLVPDGEVGQQAFAVIREAIRKEGMVALGRVVFTSREHVTRSNPGVKVFSGLRCAIRMRSAKRMNISRTLQMKKFQRTCWTWPRTSSKPNPATLSLTNLTIITRARSRSC